MALSVISTVSYASDAGSPIFGKAKIKVMRKNDAAKVVGKGSTADYYGYYGNVYASRAQYYGNLGRTYNSYSNETAFYGAARNNAQAAANNYARAYYYAGY